MCATREALKAAANRGRVIVLGSPHGKVTLDLYSELHKKELSLIGAYHPNCPEEGSSYRPWGQKQNAEMIINCLTDGKLNFLPLITHRKPCSKAAELYSALANNQEHSLAAIIEWD